MAKDQYLDARDAAEALGVSTATLYAYVSRGLIRSEAMADGKRTRRYHREDIERLKDRKELRRNPAQVATKALHLGSPVLESALTLIADGRLYYRGYEAVTLATGHNIEEVAALLWLGRSPTLPSPLFEETHWKLPPRCLALRKRLSELMTDLAPIERFQMMLPVAATEDLAAYDFRPLAVAHTGARILRLLTLLAVGRQSSAGTITETLQQGWLPQHPEATPILRMALVLCADHELNVSAFTARCVASANSTPYGVVTAGLSALQGAKHGGYTDQVEAFLREVQTPDQARTVIGNRLKRGEKLPGFGHPLYPNGDPRGSALLERVENAYPQTSAVALSKAVIAQVERTIGQYPTIDFALVTLTNALRLPSGTALTLFAIGRTIGWIGHAIEQYQLDQLIRPRAQYVGPAPLSF